MIVSVVLAVVGSGVVTSGAFRRPVLLVELSALAAADRLAGDFAVFIVVAASDLLGLTTFADAAFVAFAGAAFAVVFGAVFAALAGATADFGAAFFADAAGLAAAFVAGLAAAFIGLTDADFGAGFGAALVALVVAFAANAFPAGFGPGFAAVFAVPVFAAAVFAVAVFAVPFTAASTGTALALLFVGAFGGGAFTAVFVAARIAMGWLRAFAAIVSSLLMARRSFGAVMIYSESNGRTRSQFRRTAGFAPVTLTCAQRDGSWQRSSAAGGRSPML